MAAGRDDHDEHDGVIIKIRKKKNVIIIKIHTSQFILHPPKTRPLAEMIISTRANVLT